jgi:hypothetical protein
MISVGNDTMAPNDWIRVHQEAIHFREVKMDLVDSMDNQYRMTFKKDERGDYKYFATDKHLVISKLSVVLMIWNGLQMMVIGNQ